jgi:signal transduction histidine kinase
VSAHRSWRGVRGRLLLVVLAAVVVAIAATIFGFNRLFTASSTRDANALVRGRAASALAGVQVVNGKVRVREVSADAELDGLVWVFSGGQVIEKPRAEQPVDLAARQLAGTTARLRDVADADIRLYAVPIASDGVRRGTLVAGISLKPYEQTEATALRDSVLLGAVLLLVVGFASWWLLASALRLVGRMTEQAELWSERELDRRFNLGPPQDELTQLGATLDGLLDRLGASLRHERRFSAELSHELRTPLARIIAEAELALRRERKAPEYREALGDVLRNARQVARIIDALVAAARHEAAPSSGTADAFGVATSVAAHCESLAVQSGVTIQVEPPSTPVRLGVDGDLAERILHPVVENACRYGATTVRISLARTDGRVLFSVEDDGSGVGHDEHMTIFEPGTRGSAGRIEGNGAGLGLALARRLARSASGDVETRAGDQGGSFVVDLPAG